MVPYLLSGFGASGFQAAHGPAIARFLVVQGTNQDFVIEETQRSARLESHIREAAGRATRETDIRSICCGDSHR
jgi:hypothetical protein